MIPSHAGWPEWWQWELDCANPHLAKRMVDRSFGETDLRDMLERAATFRPDAAAGRFIVETTRDGQPWEVVVEPDEDARLLIVVTAFAVG